MANCISTSINRNVCRGACCACAVWSAKSKWRAVRCISAPRGVC
ncbi:hypothetical protein DSM3645_03398 [Blastopirellula marina DSM 3645]|uniref:Uncharacterized protein n=1 Tax=Blastopirellula marina DSM 3645 TaxID=314230 RepID=A3ZVZ3_9BACT|nr:hypothetical protein DSM3645_03398 [Blastopirellula marina DSM 3645]